MSKVLPYVVAATEIAVGVGLVASGVGGPLGASLIVAGSLQAVGAVAGTFMGGPDVPSTLGARKTNITQSDAPWRLIYGKTRVGGVIRYAGTGGFDKDFMHLIIVLACHRVKSIGAMYRNGEQVTDVDGVPLKKWGDDRFRIVKRLGDDDQPAVQELIDAMPNDWTPDHRLRGMAYVYVRLKFSEEHLPDGKGELSFDVEGNDRVYDPRTDSFGYSQNPALCIADYLTASKYGVGASYADLDTDDLIASANACDEGVTITNDASPPGSPATITQPRFVCNGAVNLDSTHASVLQALAASMAGKVIPSGPTWRILAGIWREPAVSINQDLCRAGLSIAAKRESSSVANTMKGTFVGAETKYEPTDYSPVAAQDWLDDDRGVEIDGSQDFAFTDDHNTCRRIGKILLSQGRRQVSVSWPGTIACYRLRPGDTVAVDFDRYGWSAKTFEVGQLALSIENDAGGMPQLVVDTVLNETDENVFAWSTDDEVPPPVPLSTSLADPSQVTSPDTCTVATGSAYAFTRADGSWISRLYVSWPAPHDIFVLSGGTIQVQYKATSASDWSPGPVVPGDSLFAYVDGVADGVSYRARIRSVNVAGGLGQWVESGDIVVRGKVSAALDVTELDVVTMPDGTRQFTWDLPSRPADLAGFVIRYATGTGRLWSEMDPLNVGRLTSSPWETNQLDAGTYTFAIKAYDRSGNESANAAFVEATLPDPRLQNALLQRDERALGWPGTKVDCFVNRDTLRLEAEGDGDWTDVPDQWQGEADSWLAIIPSKTPITYETPVIDLGFLATFTPRLTVDAIGTVTASIRASVDPLDGSPTVDYEDLGQIETARYVQVKIQVDGDSPYVRTATLTLTADLRADAYYLLDTSGATGTPIGFEHLGTGHFKVETHGRIANISTAQVLNFQGSTPLFATLVSRSTTITGGTNPAAEFKIFDSSGTAADGVVDVELRGPASGGFITASIPAPPTVSTPYTNGYRVMLRKDTAALGLDDDLALGLVLIHVSTATFKSVGNGGYVNSSAGWDIRVETDDGTKVPHVVLSYDPTTGEAWLLARPEPYATAGQPLRVYGGNPAVAAPEADPTGFRGTDLLALVDLATGADLTGQGRDFALSSVDTATGPFGDAANPSTTAGVEIDADGDWLDGLDALSAGIFVNPATVDADGGFLAAGPTSSDDAGGISFRVDGIGYHGGAKRTITLELAVGDVATRRRFEGSTDDVAAGRWQLPAFSWSSGNVMEVTNNGTVLTATNTADLSTAMTGTTFGGIPSALRAGFDSSLSGLAALALYFSRSVPAAEWALYARNLRFAEAFTARSVPELNDGADALVAIPVFGSTDTATALDLDPLAVAVGTGTLTLSDASAVLGTVSIAAGKLHYVPPLMPGDDVVSYTLSDGTNTVDGRCGVTVTAAEIIAGASPGGSPTSGVDTLANLYGAISFQDSFEIMNAKVGKVNFQKFRAIQDGTLDSIGFWLRLDQTDHDAQFKSSPDGGGGAYVAGKGYTGVGAYSSGTGGKLRITVVGLDDNGYPDPSNVLGYTAINGGMTDPLCVDSLINPAIRDTRTAPYAETTWDFVAGHKPVLVGGQDYAFMYVNEDTNSSNWCAIDCMRPYAAGAPTEPYLGGPGPRNHFVTYEYWTTVSGYQALTTAQKEAGRTTGTAMYYVFTYTNGDVRGFPYWIAGSTAAINMTSTTQAAQTFRPTEDLSVAAIIIRAWWNSANGTPGSLNVRVEDITSGGNTLVGSVQVLATEASGANNGSGFYTPTDKFARPVRKAFSSALSLTSGRDYRIRVYPTSGSWAMMSMRGLQSNSQVNGQSLIPILDYHWSDRSHCQALSSTNGGSTWSTWQFTDADWQLCFELA